MDEEVIDDAPVGIEERGVLDLSIDQLCRIVGGQPLDQRQRVASTDLDLPHMAHIEEADAGPHRQVLLNGSRRVLHRHLPPSEIDETSAEPAVLLE